MITKKLLVSILTIAVFCNCNAQNSDNPIAKNSVYLEIAGSAALLYNITYDRIIYTKEKNHLSVACGAQYFNLPGLDDPVLSISPQFNYLYGVKHHFETGVGVTFNFLQSGGFVIPIRIGYRFQKPEGGIFWKIAFTPVITNEESIFGEGFYIAPWAGVAIGRTF